MYEHRSVGKRLILRLGLIPMVCVFCISVTTILDGIGQYADICIPWQEYERGMPVPLVAK